MLQFQMHTKKKKKKKKNIYIYIYIYNFLLNFEVSLFTFRSREYINTAHKDNDTDTLTDVLGLLSFHSCQGSLGDQQILQGPVGNKYYIIRNNYKHIK